MGHYVFLIGPFYLLLVIFVDSSLLRWLAFMVPALRREPNAAKIAAARKKSEHAAKRAAEPKMKYWFGILFSILYIGASILMPIGYFVPVGLVQKVLRRIGYCMLIVNIYLFMAIFLFFILGLLLWLFRVISRDCFERGTYLRIGLTIAILAGLGMVVYGEINARIIRVNHYEISVDKDGGKIPVGADGKPHLRIALIGDLHLGYNAGASMMRDMVDKINKEDVDLVLIAGDIFDNAYDAIENDEELIEILASLKSKYATLAVYGNHDVEDNLIFGFNFSAHDKLHDERYYKFLEKANISLLEDEVLDLFDESVYIVGRRDEEEPGLRLSQGEKRKTAGELTRNLDKSKILIDLEHEPKEVPEVAAAGFDLQLAGHTHNGQFFPLNLGIGRIYFNAFGYKVYENKLHTVTTAGVGSYGPFNRACVDPEIMILDITFQ